MKLKRLSELFGRSSIPGLANLFATRQPFRRLLWAVVFGLCLLLTMHSLLEILREYLQYPITVNVLVSESRVLRFPAVTVCNLNPLHRGRFCQSTVDKPAALQQVLCASLDSLMQVCGVYELLNQLVTQGERICNANNSSRRRKKPPNRKPTASTSNINNKQRNRFKNQLPINTSSNVQARTDKPNFQLDQRVRNNLTASLNLDESFWSELERIMNENDLDNWKLLLNDFGLSEADLDWSHDQFWNEWAESDSVQTVDLPANAENENGFSVDQHSIWFDLSKSKNRSKRQINFRTIFRLFHSLATGRFSSFKQILELLGITGESEAFFDNMIVQIAKFARIHINSTQDLIPALFLKSFADTTGCQIGASSNNVNSRNNINLALQNLTKAFTNPKCILKLPRLFELFSRQSKNLTEGLYRCTGNWVGNLLKDELSPSFTQRQSDRALNETEDEIDFNVPASEENRNSENSWYILLDILRSWIAELGRKHIDEAIWMGHQKHDLISSCYFAGKRCDFDKDLQSFFFSTYGNCYTYNFQVNEETQQSLTGFTGPQFGLELVLNLETNEYMPTTREIGAKVMVHDPKKKADPEQDAVQIQPGVVTYVGVQMINISRAPAPYKDRCSDDWPTEDQRQWAKSAEHPTYTTQVCLKMCLQKEIISDCGCWTLTAPGPIDDTLPICNTRKNQTAAECTTRVRNEYYAKRIVCNCPPRCSEEIYEKFVSTGKESRQCSALSANGEQEKSSGDDTNNYAKLLVYYQSLSYNAIQQSPKYTSETLVGAVGGILGVYLGFSFLAIYEFVEILVRSGYLLCFLPRSKSTDAAQPEQPAVYTSETSILNSTHSQPEENKSTSKTSKSSSALLYDTLYQMQHQVK